MDDRHRATSRSGMNPLLQKTAAHKRQSLTILTTTSQSNWHPPPA